MLHREGSFSQQIYCWLLLQPLSTPFHFNTAYCEQANGKRDGHPNDWTILLKRYLKSELPLNEFTNIFISLQHLLAALILPKILNPSGQKLPVHLNYHRAGWSTRTRCMCSCNTKINAAPDPNSYRGVKAVPGYQTLTPIKATDRTGRLCHFGVTDHKGHTQRAEQGDPQGIFRQT